MPENPEVITVARSLEPSIIHKKITGCNVYWDNIIASPSVSRFKEEIIGEVISSISTRGKFLVLTLTHYSLLIHLRMEGKFVFRDVGSVLGKHEHVELILDDAISFRYHDVRKFGKMYLIPKKETFLVKPLVELGVEFDDKKLTPGYLIQAFSHKKLPIKTVLLDQSIIAGIGNIYDDEILFLSGIHPLQEACTLSIDDCLKIIENTRVVLSHAIQLGGTTIRSFTSSEGVHGLFQNELLIHGKDICFKCGNCVVKEQIHGRGTYYCPNCQKIKK